MNSVTGNPALFWLRTPLVGLGQIMFQESALTGLFFIAGIAIASPLMAAAALAGSILGTITARLLQYDIREIAGGLYGFNSALVGIACYFFMQPGMKMHLLVAAGAILAAIVTQLLRTSIAWPTYTSAFVVVTWVLLAAAEALGVAKVEHPAGPQTLSAVRAVTEGLSEVMFQANVLTGILFLGGIALNSRQGAAWALVGSLAGLIVALWVHDPVGSVSEGIFGYNAALAAMALALYKRSAVLPVVAAVISVPISERFPLSGLPTLTAPFVLASWLVLAWDWLDAYLAKVESSD